MRLWDQERVIQEIRDIRDRNCPFKQNTCWNDIQTYSRARATTSVLGAPRSMLRNQAGAQERI